MTKNEIETLKKELKQLPFLEKELKMWEEQLMEISADNSLQSPVWDRHGTRSTRISDKTAEIAAYREECRKISDALRLKVEKQRAKLLSFISSVDDSLYRQILYYRHVKGLEWIEVAFRVGGSNNDNSIKKTYCRMFQKNYNFKALTEEPETLLQ